MTAEAVDAAVAVVVAGGIAVAASENVAVAAFYNAAAFAVDRIAVVVAVADAAPRSCGAVWSALAQLAVDP